VIRDAADSRDLQPNSQGMHMDAYPPTDGRMFPHFDARQIRRIVLKFDLPIRNRRNDCEPFELIHCGSAIDTLRNGN
jgi:hypothetical protein